MAKKKTRKNNKMPPLYWGDKMIYIVLIGLLVFLLGAYLIFTIFDVEQLYFREQGVIAYERHASVFWAFPSFFLLLSFIVGLGSAFSSRRPIFGIPNFLYGPSKYPRIYPIFSKNKPKKKTTAIVKRNTLIFGSILGVLILTILFTSVLPFAGRDCLYSDGSIRQYTVFNTAKAEYTSGQIMHIEFSVQYRRNNHSTNIRGVPHYLRPKSFYVTMTITTTDNREYHFRSYCFCKDTDTNWIEYMLQIKDLYPENMITCDADGIERLIEQKQLDETQQELLYKLFHLEP